jgi:type VI secretion system secreted protein VgrG
MQRTMEIVTPLGPDVLLLRRMRTREELSRLSEFDIELLSEERQIAPASILGRNVTVRLELEGDAVRHFNGYVTRFGQAGMQGRYHAYRALVRPWLWFLTRTADCRIFQELSVPEIVKQVFADHGMADLKDELTYTYPKRSYCVQYRETDFDFVSRLLEQEGIYYFFEHAAERHTLVLADATSVHVRAPGYETLRYIEASRLVRPDQEVVSRWDQACEIQPGRYRMTDYDFERPRADLMAHAAATRENVLADYEVYDYPGVYRNSADGEQYVDARLDELQARFDTVRAAGTPRGVAAGRLFEFAGHPRADQNGEYLVTAVDYTMSVNEYETEPAPGTVCTCEFTALSSRQQFRPRRLTPVPVVKGPQTAVVVGPAGDEIFTDKYGRVKVQFHWDRYGKKNENSSCWVRVAQPWAGKNWGMMAVPRIGQEVVVDFLEGDPDQPIITGRVYNAEQMPPWALPANMTQSGVLTRSSKGGSGANANELRFEDKKGAEQVYLHAEKNQDISVENDETHSVGHDRSKSIGHDETYSVGHDRSKAIGHDETTQVKHDRTETVGNNEIVGIGGNRSISVGASETASVALQRTHTVGINETITVGAAQEVTIGAFQMVTVGANQTVSVGAAHVMTIGASQMMTVGAKQAVSVGAAQDVSIGAAQSIKVGADMSEQVGGAQSYTVAEGRTTSIGEDDALKVGKNLIIDAADSVTIKTGSASITMNKDGTIHIKGQDVTINGSGKIKAQASSDVVIKGSKVGIN